MTYGDHQEAASAALLRLLDLGTTDPRDPGDAEHVLALRHQVHLALAERLKVLSGQVPQRHRTDRTISAAKYPVLVLQSVLDALPRSQDTGRAPSDVLGPLPSDAPEAVRQWRHVARHLALGNADLATAVIGLPQRQPAGWYLLGDLSTTLEALVVLDAGLARRHLLPRDRGSYLRARLAVGDVTRMAAWRGTDSRLDFALSPTTETSFPDDGPRIHLIRRPEDYAPAQRALAGFMRPRPLEDTDHPLDERPGLHAARVIAEGQIRLAGVFAAWADRAGDPHLAQRFRSRIAPYVELHRSTLRMTELKPTRPLLVDLQQSEMVQQLGRYRTRPMPRFSLYDLDAATRDVAIHVGKSLRREGLRRKNLLVLEPGRPGARPITNTRNRFNLACRALARDAPLANGSVSVFRHQRTALAKALSV